MQQLILSSYLAYQNIRDTWCVGSYGSYNSLNDAMSACTADATCGKVYDENCDNQDVFKLCKKNTQVIVASSGSCIYEKKGR